MRPRVLFISILFAICATAASAQGILPNSFGKWTGSTKPGLTPPVIFNGDKVGSMLAIQQAAALKEYGFVAGEEGTYARGADTLQMTLYKMKDPSGAYGEYSYLRTPDMPRAGLAEHSSMSHERALVLIGNLVLEIRGHELQKFLPDIKAVIATVTPRAELGLYPTLWDRLPRKGLVERTDRYVLGSDVLSQLFPFAEGDWLGFSQGAEAELATYRLAGRDVVLLVADFPTPQTAQKKLAELQQKYNVNGKTDGGSVPLFARRSITLLAIVRGVNTQAEADVLLNQVSSTAEVTWNEPNFEVTQPNIGTIIVGTIIGTGLICAFALISGIAFGGFRLVVKRFFPDKVFDRSGQMQVLQLGLTSKPINAEDFYGLGGAPPK
jgi:hypothetical protein